MFKAKVSMIDQFDVVYTKIYDSKIYDSIELDEMFLYIKKGERIKAVIPLKYLQLFEEIEEAENQ